MNLGRSRTCWCIASKEKNNTMPRVLYNQTLFDFETSAGLVLESGQELTIDKPLQGEVKIKTSKNTRSQIIPFEEPFQGEH